MAKIRSIHPEACESDDLAHLSDFAERTFWRLLPHTDDEGRGKDHPRLLLAKLYPLQQTVTADDVDKAMGELAEVGVIVRYQVDGERFYAIPSWERWQKPKYRSASKLPGPDQADPTPPPPEPTSPPDRPPITPHPDLPPIAPRSSPDIPHGEVLERERESRGRDTSPDGDDGAAVVAEPKVDEQTGVPLESRGTASYTRTVADWLIEQGGQPPPGEPRHEVYRWVIRELGARLPSSDVAGLKRLRGRYRQVLVDYIRDVLDEDLKPPEWGWLGSIVANHGPLLALDGLAEAADWGAGRDPEHAGKSKLSYAMGVIKNRTRAAA